MTWIGESSLDKYNYNRRKRYGNETTNEKSLQIC